MQTNTDTRVMESNIDSGSSNKRLSTLNKMFANLIVVEVKLTCKWLYTYVFALID